MSTRTKKEIFASAKAGAEFLDKYMPGWPVDIDKGLLDMSSCNKCVLCQATRQNWFWSAVDMFDLSDSELVQLGFESSYFDDYSLLEEAWLEEIQKRLDEITVQAP